MDDYTALNEKYKKYKMKYISLKNQIGGDSKVTKEESGYVNAYPAIRCGTCKYFEASDETLDIESINGLPKVTGCLGKCDIVGGTIHEYGCCNLWTPHGAKLKTDFSCGDDLKDKLKKQ